MQRLAQNLWPTLVLAIVLLALTIAAPTWWSYRNLTTAQPEPQINIRVVERPAAIEEAFSEPPRLETLKPQDLSRFVERGPILSPSDVERHPLPVDPDNSTLIPDPDDGATVPVFAAIDMNEPLPAARSERETLPQMADPLPLSQMMEPGPRESTEHEPVAPQMKTQVAPPPVWPQSAALEQQLERLQQQEPNLTEWITSLQQQLTELRQSAAYGSQESQKSLGEIASLREIGNRLAQAEKNETTRVRILRVLYSLNRRLALWNSVYNWASHDRPALISIPTRDEWQQTHTAVFSRLAADPIGGTWAKYLRAMELRQLTSDGLSPEERRELARDVLRRLTSSQLTDDQLQFLQKPPFDRLARDLLRFAAEPLNVTSMLQAVERNELEESSVNSLPVAKQYEIARWSIDPLEVKLAEELNAHYRNANFRVAISGELINRMLPKVSRSYESVVDNIRGAAVQGDSETEARLRLVLLPDRLRWRLGLEARGEVASSTASMKGPATFYQDGVSSFRARKLLTIDRRNIRLFGAEAEADSANMLRDYQTNYDGIPILGSIARSLARQQYDEESWAAKAEVDQKIAGRASQHLDTEVNAKMQKAKNDLQAKLLAPLRNLDLDPTAVDMETTTDRLIARYRLAGHEQLAANTPRPQAPGDSLLSVQIHQSSLNNVLQHLKLDGQQVELRKLYSELAETFLRQKMPVPEDIPENVYVTFAAHDAVRVDCDKGKVRLTIRLQELSHNGDKAWKNFAVRAYYVPDADQLNANLVRDGVIELSGKNLRLGDQVALRGIFSKVLSKNRTVNLINDQIRQSKELSDLRVSQFAIQDGWVGVALATGPRQPIKPKLTTPPQEQVNNEGSGEPVAEAPPRTRVSESLRQRRQ